MDTMKFPSTWKEFADEFSFCDSKEVYTNGIKLIPVFRVEQWLEHIRGESMHIGEKDFLQYRVHALTSQKAELKRRYESMLKEYEELQEKLKLIESEQIAGRVIT